MKKKKMDNCISLSLHYNNLSLYLLCCQITLHYYQCMSFSRAGTHLIRCFLVTTHSLTNKLTDSERSISSTRNNDTHSSKTNSHLHAAVIM